MEKGIISVDKWTESSQAYFLTHLHSDHTKGLSSNWNKGPLFCSSITAKLFPSKFPDFKSSLLIKVLEIGSHYSISLFSPSSGAEITVQVVAIDADHCPGAVMYLFRGEFGCVLYTGDFRWEGISEKALLGKSMLLNALGSDRIDVLYLDNTYCNPSYSFPPREVVAQQVVNIIASHPEHDIVIAINTLGKEDLLLHISRALKIKIWVWPERLQTMHLLGIRDIFTTKTCHTRVRAVPFYSFSINTLEELNKMHPTIGIMPSGLPWVVRPFEENGCSLGSSHFIFHDRSKITNSSDIAHRSQQAEVSGSVRKFHHCIYSVPYSDHSCFNELQEFVNLLQPLTMKGIVSSSSCDTDPHNFLGNLCGLKQTIEQSSKKFQRRKVNGNAETVQVKPVTGRDKSVDVKLERERYMKPRVSWKRVRVIRRLRQGAKIVGSINID